MPRIPNSLIRKAHAIDIFLPALLAPCRDLHTAQNELRWLREHVEKVAKARRAYGDALAKGALLRQLVKERASGKPLQYILGTEYFGDVEIRCRPGVLIPRQDTATSITHLVQLLRNAQKLPSELRLLDLCTGTGCVALLFRHELYSACPDVDLRALGVDISDEALNLAQHNMLRMRKSKTNAEKGQMQFMKADVLVNPFADQVDGPLPLKVALNHNGHPSFWDILISNPPYISPSGLWKTTTRSVRGYEPKLALIPPPKTGQDDTQQGDLFYPRLLRIAQDIEAKVVLLEVADLEQALRVARCARDLGIFDGIEIWREDPGADAKLASEEDNFIISGEGNARSVLCWRGAGAAWVGKSTSTISPYNERLPLQSSNKQHEDPERPDTNEPMEARFDSGLITDSLPDSSAKPMSRPGKFSKKTNYGVLRSEWKTTRGP